MPASTTRYRGRAELTLRIGAADNLFVRRLYGLAPGSTPASHRPARLAVDAHVPSTAGGAALARSALEAGVPFLIDPETYYLQDTQHVDAPWCSVPYAVTRACTPSDLLSVTAQDALVKSVIDYQIAHGASAVIAP
ncbi:MAG: hypothetical protein ACOYBY_12960 [Dermatophilaceae bacterium]